MPYQIVVMGASAGGTTAINSILRKLPQDFPVPIAIVLHRAENTNSLRQMLQKNSALPVQEVQDKTLIQQGNVYLAPANYHLIVDKEYFSLSIDEPLHFSRPSIDILCESAADSFGDNVIGILLTGNGCDGAAGLSLIIQCGGHTIVQDPETAESRAMPEAAIKLAVASQVLSLNQIPEQLIRLCLKRD